MKTLLLIVALMLAGCGKEIVHVANIHPECGIIYAQPNIPCQVHQ